MWTNAIMYKTFGLNALIVYMVSLPMFFNSLIFIAMLAIVELRKKITVGYFLLTVIILLMSDIIPYISAMFPVINGWMPLLDSPKLLPIFLFLFASIVLFKYNRKYEAYYAVLILPVLNVIPIVAVWSTIGIVLLINTIRTQKIDWKYWTPFLSTVFLYLIYVIIGSPANSARGREVFHWGLFRLFITQSIVYMLAYAHVIMLIFLLNKKYLWHTIKKIWFIFIITFFVTMIVSIFMRQYNYDATQFVTGIITVMVYVFVVYTFLATVTSIPLTLKKKILIAVFGGLSLFMSTDAYMKTIHNNPWSHEYESAILKNIPSQKEYRIGFYISSNVIAGNYSSDIVDAITISDVLDYYYNNVFHYAVNKGEHEVRYNTDLTPFRDYYMKRKEQSSTISDDDIRIDFIKENAIEYIRIFKSASPSDEFLSHLSLLAEDVITGQRFYKVNNEKK
jgi:hypothetical protein